MLDGFDVQAIGYVAPAIKHEWLISDPVLGRVVSAALVGVLFGSLFLSMLADKIGRRPILVGSCLFFSVTTLLTARAQSVDQLLIIRFIAGIGLGAIMPNVMALVSEYTPRRMRVTMMMVVSNGFTAGAAVGGFIAAWLIPAYGWRSVFYCGGAIPLLIGAAMLIALPESLQFMVVKGKDGGRIAKWLRHIDPAAAAGGASTQYVVAESKESARVPFVQLFHEGRAVGTLFAANFYAMHEDPQEMAETVSMAFLGMSIQCAHCHDHPLEKWTNDDYYGMANLFARVRGKDGNDSRIIFVADSGELIQPRTGRPQAPRPLDAAPVSFDSTADRRNVLADWLTDPKNPYFSRSIVNRVWANFMGRGLVEAVDDMRLTNPPSNSPLLTALADDLAQRRVRPQGPDAEDSDFGHLSARERDAARKRRGRAVLFAILSAAAEGRSLVGRSVSGHGFADGFQGAAGRHACARAGRLGGRLVFSRRLRSSGAADHLRVRAVQRTEHVASACISPTATRSTPRSRRAAIASITCSAADDDAIVEDLYLSALSRLPSAAERQKLTSALTQVEDSDRLPALADLRQRIAAAQTVKDPARTPESAGRRRGTDSRDPG